MIQADEIVKLQSNEAILEKKLADGKVRQSFEESHWKTSLFWCDEALMKPSFFFAFIKKFKVLSESLCTF